MKKNLFLCFAVFLFLGCATEVKLPANNLYSPNYSGIERGSRILIAPVAKSFDELADGGEVIYQAIVEQLEYSGWSVAVMSEKKSAEIWEEVTAKMGEAYSPSAMQLDSREYKLAIAEFLKSIDRPDRFSAIIFPSIIFTEAKFKGQHAYWDGVRRYVEVKGHNPSRISWSGTTIGLSLSIMAFEPSARWLFTSYGGLVLPYNEVYKKSHFRRELRDGIFEKEKDIRFGVWTALLPMIKSRLIK